MLYGLFVTLFVILCFLMVLIILIQKGKSSMGLGGLGGSSQMLFGGSGGQDLFQKITWVMVALFMTGSLILAMIKSSGGRQVSYNKYQSRLNREDASPFESRPEPIQTPAPTEPAKAAQPAQPAEQTPTPNQ